MLVRLVAGYLEALCREGRGVAMCEGTCGECRSHCFVVQNGETLPKSVG